ncbi:MAG: hypothetical protein EXR30_06325 [Betaproteobacteria bacterium]|nr:hypothetical protein [Betaproteobacteria bacterium]
MSRIIDKLRQAEEQRESIVAERKRLEIEADTALAVREHEERVQQSDSPMPKPSPKAAEIEKMLAAARAVPLHRRPATWLWAGAALVGAAMLLYAVPEGQVSPSAKVQPFGQVPLSAKVPLSVASERKFELRLERDADGFAARVREKEGQ